MKTLSEQEKKTLRDALLTYRFYQQQAKEAAESCLIEREALQASLNVERADILLGRLMGQESPL